MRVIAFLALFFGIGVQPMLDGHVFDHAVMGIIFGTIAAACGFGSAMKDYSNKACRWEGAIMGCIGIALAVACSIQLPSARKGQESFHNKGRIISLCSDALNYVQNLKEQNQLPGFKKDDRASFSVLRDQTHTRLLYPFYIRIAGERTGDPMVYRLFLTKPQTNAPWHLIQATRQDTNGLLLEQFFPYPSSTNVTTFRKDRAK